MGSGVHRHRRAAGRGHERDQPSEAAPVQQRNERRARHRQGRHRQPEIESDVRAGRPRLQREEHRVGESQGHQGVARGARHVDERIGVQGMIRFPHPGEGRGGPSPSGAYPRGARLLLHVGPGGTRAAGVHGGYGAEIRSRRSSWTIFGFADPRVFFMTWPTSALRAPSLPPRNCSTGPGFSVRTSSTRP